MIIEIKKGDDQTVKKLRAYYITENPNSTSRTHAIPYIVDNIVCNLGIATARWKTETGGTLRM